MLDFYSKLGCFEVAKMEGFPKDIIIMGRSLWRNTVPQWQTPWAARGLKIRLLPSRDEPRDDLILHYHLGVPWLGGWLSFFLGFVYRSTAESQSCSPTLWLRRPQQRVPKRCTSDPWSVVKWREPANRSGAPVGISGAPPPLYRYTSAGRNNSASLFLWFNAL